LGLTQRRKLDAMRSEAKLLGLRGHGEAQLAMIHLTLQEPEAALEECRTRTDSAANVDRLIHSAGAAHPGWRRLARRETGGCRAFDQQPRVLLRALGLRSALLSRW
jgi:hypothetical protein